MEEHNKNIRDITYLAELIPASWRGLIRAITYSPPTAVCKLCAH